MMQNRLVQHTLQVMWRWHGQMKAISWHALPVTLIAVARRDLSPVTGTMSQATKTNGVVRLPCGYLYDSTLDTE